jgi:hypothetical protein
MGNFASDKLGAGTILWAATERPIVAPDGTLYWDVTDENFYIRKFSTWVPLTAGGVGSINGLIGAITLAAGTNITIVPVGNTLTFNSTGTIGGSIAATQVAFGSGANTISGDPNFTFTDSSNVTQLNFDSSGFADFLQFNITTGNAVLSSNGSGTGSLTLTMAGTNIFKATRTAGVTTVALVAPSGVGSVVFTAGIETISGTTSGSAAIGVAAVAGTPAQINLPTATGAAGTFLQTNGATPQQTSWVAAGTLIASGTSTLTANGALGAVTSQAAITTSAPNTLTTDAIEWSYATAPGAGDSLCHISPYVTAGNVNFVRSNPTASAQAVTALVINWRVIR